MTHNFLFDLTRKMYKRKIKASFCYHDGVIKLTTTESKTRVDYFKDLVSDEKDLKPYGPSNRGNE